MDKTNRSLHERIRVGDIPAFEDLFDAHYLGLCIYAKKIVQDVDEARDIVQDVFVALYDNRHTLEIKSSVKSYLYRAVRNACLNHLKQASTRNSHHEYLKYRLPAGDEQDQMIKIELEQKILEAIQSLPGKCREIFEMNRFEGKKNKEIAEILGLSVRTVETQISNALKILREHMADFLMVLMVMTTQV